jgi:hypothetical protein
MLFGGGGGISISEGGGGDFGFRFTTKKKTPEVRLVVFQDLFMFFQSDHNFLARILVIYYFTFTDLKSNMECQLLYASLTR